MSFPCRSMTVTMPGDALVVDDLLDRHVQTPGRSDGTPTGFGRPRAPDLRATGGWTEQRGRPVRDGTRRSWRGETGARRSPAPHGATRRLTVNERTRGRIMAILREDERSWRERPTSGRAYVRRRTIHRAIASCNAASFVGQSAQAHPRLHRAGAHRVYKWCVLMTSHLQTPTRSGGFPRFASWLQGRSDPGRSPADDRQHRR
mgnify:CR=1 FL=1